MPVRGREIATSHNMREVMRMATAWYGPGIGGGGGGDKTSIGAEGNGGGGGNGDRDDPEGR